MTVLGPLLLLALGIVLLSTLGVLTWGAVTGLVGAVRDALLELSAVRARSARGRGPSALPTGPRVEQPTSLTDETSEAMWHRMQGTRQGTRQGTTRRARRTGR